MATVESERKVVIGGYSSACYHKPGDDGRPACGVLDRDQVRTISSESARLSRRPCRHPKCFGSESGTTRTAATERRRTRCPLCSARIETLTDHLPECPQR